MYQLVRKLSSGDAMNVPCDQVTARAHNANHNPNPNPDRDPDPDPDPTPPPNPVPSDPLTPLLTLSPSP